MTWHVLSIASTFYFFQCSEIKCLILYIFISLEMYSWSLSRQNGQKKLLEKNTSDFYVTLTVCFTHSNLETKIKYTDIQFSPIYFSKKEGYYHRAQVDFDFGQVHIVWWLSYWQVAEKISVEPSSDLYKILYMLWPLCWHMEIIYKHQLANNTFQQSRFFIKVKLCSEKS